MSRTRSKVANFIFDTSLLLIVGAAAAVVLASADTPSYDANAVLDEAVQAYSGGDASNSELAAARYERANTHFHGHLDTSDALNRRVLDIYRTLHGERHPQVAEALICQWS